MSGFPAEDTTDMALRDAILICNGLLTHSREAVGVDENNGSVRDRGVAVALSAWNSVRSGPCAVAVAVWHTLGVKCGEARRAGGLTALPHHIVRVVLSSASE